MEEKRDQKRKNKRRQMKRLLSLLMAIILLAAAALAVQLGSSIYETINDSGQFSKIRKQVREDGGDLGALETIEANSKSYPGRMLEALANNEELLQFVADYPEKKDTYEENITLEADGDRSIPLLMQWDPRWGYARYGDGCIGLDGCGPTCLSMVAAGLKGDASCHPKYVADFAMQNGYISDHASTSWSLMTSGAESLGLTAWEVPLSEERMAEALTNGNPIICTVRPGDFTTTGHFIVLYGYEDGRFYVNDPNSRKRSERTWSYEQLSPQIKAMWAYAAAQ